MQKHQRLLRVRTEPQMSLPALKNQYVNEVLDQYKHKILSDLKPYMDLYAYSNTLYKQASNETYHKHENVYFEAIVDCVYLLYEAKFNIFNDSGIF